MVERLISFAGSENGVYGAIGLGTIDGTAAATGFVGGPEGSLELSDASVSRGEGTLRITSGEAELIVGLAAQTSALGFETGEGRSLTVQAIGASGELSGATINADSGFEATGVAWAVEGEGDQSALRTLWSALADGSLLVLFGLRPAGVEHHGSETVGAARIASDGAVTSYAEPLLSTEYDAAGRHTRATLELWSEEGDGLPTRGGGARALGGEGGLGAATLRAARFDWRLEGTAGFGGYEIFSA